MSRNNKLRKHKPRLVALHAIIFLIAAALAFSVPLSILRAGKEQSPSLQYPSITIKNQLGQLVNVKVEIADEPSEWLTGLMNRDYLAQNSGMLFIYPEQDYRSFWMKNTKIPLDMLFINLDGLIVDVHTAKPCTEEDCPIYTSINPAWMVLEVNAGFADKNRVRVGDSVIFK
jgi:uncharacterized protein